MSDENREQIAALVDDFWNHTLDGIAGARKLPVKTLAQLADSFRVQVAEDAVQTGLADGLAYEDEALHLVAGLSGLDSAQKPRLVGLDEYSNLPVHSGKYTEDRIAVVFATGEIGGDEGDEQSIGSRTMIKVLARARRDDKVKAIVLRVNSPGGSALASDEIWREVKLAAAEKPVVVSMGHLAASGGYYISCAATRIVAEPNTITGSIGVLGVILNYKNFLDHKLGITFDQYKTSRFADLFLPTHSMSEAEKRIIRNMVDDVYREFTAKVADGRHLPVALVDSIGQGRVWSGEDALNLGLVDTLGNLSDAIDLAARLAGTDQYRIRELPEQKEPLQQVLEGFGTKAQQWAVRQELGDAARYYETLREITGLSKIQARIPYSIRID